MDSSVLLTVASGAEHPLIDFDLSIIFQLVIFLATMVVSSTLLFKPYLRMRSERHDGMEGARADATRLSAQADAQLADYEDKLAAARKRAQDERQTIRAEASKHHADVTGAARDKAVAAMESARAKVHTAAESARKELLPKADVLGRQIASKLLGREVA